MDPDDKPFGCSECGTMFETNKILSRHLISHSKERPFDCSRCDASFKRKDTLAQHVKTHTSAKPYRCTVCSKLFASKNGLDGHVKNSCGGLKSTSDYYKDRLYKCDECISRFKTEAALARHALTHIEGELFECSECVKMFKTKQGLTRHTTKRHVVRKSDAVKRKRSIGNEDEEDDDRVKRIRFIF